MAYGIFAMTVHLIHCTFYTALRQGFCVHLSCIAVPAGLSWPTMATTRGPCSTTSGTGTSSTRSGTPNWRPTASRTFGGIDDDGGRQVLAASYSSPYGAAPPSRHTVRSRPRRRRHALPRPALLWPDRSIDLRHQPVQLALGR